MAQVYTPKEIAAEIGTNAKRFRKFLRSDIGVAVLKEGAKPGKGHRYTIDAKCAKMLKARFATWNASNGQVAPKAAPRPKRAKKVESPEPVESVESTETPDAAETPIDA